MSFGLIRVRHSDIEYDGGFVSDFIDVHPVFHRPYADPSDGELLPEPHCAIKGSGRVEWYIVRLEVAESIARPCGRCYPVGLREWRRRR